MKFSAVCAVSLLLVSGALFANDDETGIDPNLFCAELAEAEQLDGEDRQQFMEDCVADKTEEFQGEFNDSDAE